MRRLHTIFSSETTIKPVLINHIIQDIFCLLVGGCLLLHERSAESSFSYKHQFTWHLNEWSLKTGLTVCFLDQTENFQ